MLLYVQRCLPVRDVESRTATSTFTQLLSSEADDDVELNVLGCRVDILGTNCDQCVCS